MVLAVVKCAPGFGSAGNYSFSISASDDKNHSANAAVGYEVEKVNRAPVAVEDKTIDVKLGELSEVTEFADLFSDPDNDEMTFSFSIEANDFVEAYTTETGVIFRGKALGTAKAVVTATDDKGLSTPMTLTVKVSDLSGIDGIEAEGSSLVKVNTVAFSETLSMTSLRTGLLSVEIYDASGKSIYADEVNAASGEEISVNLGGNASGLYLLRVSSADKTETHRLFKK